MRRKTSPLPTNRNCSGKSSGAIMISSKPAVSGISPGCTSFSPCSKTTARQRSGRITDSRWKAPFRTVTLPDTGNEIVRLFKNGPAHSSAPDFVADETGARPSGLDFAGRRIYRQRVVAGRGSASVAERNSGFAQDRPGGAAIRHDGRRRAVAAFDGG